MSSDAVASCNLIPVAKRLYPSTLGGIESPLTAPGKSVSISLTPCDASAGFEPVAGSNDVSITFEPPGGPVTPGPSPGGLSVSDCTLPGGRCRTLTFVMPASGLAGPAHIVVEDSGAVTVAEIAPLFLPTLSCDREPETVFQQFTVLPPPNLFADAVSGALPYLVSTVDAGGNLLTPFDYWGDGTPAQSVLAETPGSPTAIFLEGIVDIPALGAGDTQTISQRLAAQPDASSFLRSFTLNGRPLPPLLRATASGGFFGSADAVESVLRLAKNDGQGGPDIYDVTDRLSGGGAGPILIDMYSCARRDPVPLSSLRSSAETVAFVRRENAEGVNLNGDGDDDDFVAQVVDVADATQTNTERAVTISSSNLNAELQSFSYVSVPAMVAGENHAAFLESEAAQGQSDVNGDGDELDSYLRVYARDGMDVTGALDLEAATGPVVDGRALGISGERVFFRGPSAFVKAAVALPGVSDLVLSPDDDYLYAIAGSGDTVSGFSRDGATGDLTLTTSVTDGVAGADGLGGTSALAMSSDGKHIYVSGTTDNAVAVLERDVTTGALTWVEAQFDGVAGVDGLIQPKAIAVSADGANVYVACFTAIVVFSRNPVTGSLSFVEKEPTPLAFSGDLRISPDGKDLYYANNPLSVPRISHLSRDNLTGELTLLADHYDDIGNALSIAISPEGGLIYETSGRSAWKRDPATGLLTYPGSLSSCGAMGNRVAVSPDGTRLYLVSGSPGAVQICGIEGAKWEMKIEAFNDGVGGVTGLDDARTLVATADGRHFYVASASQGTIAIFRNDAKLKVFDTGSASLKTSQPYAVDVVLAGERAVIVTPEVLAGTILNDDSDMTDDVAQLVDVAAGADQVISLGYAAQQIAMSDELVAILVPEEAQNDDLNLDGDKDDRILVVYEIGAGFPPINTKISVAYAAVVGTSVVLARDGPSSGYVLSVYQHVSGGIGSLKDVYSPISDFVAAGSLVAFTSLGQLPLANMYIYDVAADEVTYTGLESNRCGYATCQPLLPYKIDPNRRTVSFLSEEFGFDLDGDGDGLDQVLVVYDVARRRAQIAGKASDDVAGTLIDDVPVFPQSFGDDDVLFTRVIESQVGEDLDGDGVITDAPVTVIAGDTDDDGALDDFDTCVEASNPGQYDLDLDELGDAQCDPIAPLCASAPLNGCLQSGKATIAIKDDADDSKDSVKWKWGKGSETFVDDFADPVNGPQQYSLCVYDASAKPQPRMNNFVLPAGVCDVKSCWSETGSGFKYKDTQALMSGVQNVTLKAGGDEKAQVSLKGKGEALPLPPLPLVGPLKVQLVVNDVGGPTTCWEATYSTFQKNDAKQVKAKSD